MRRNCLAIWCRLAIVPALLCLPCCLSPATAAAETVAYWRFENDLLDISGHGNDASATGTTFSADVFGSPVPQNGFTNLQSLQLANDAGNVEAVDYLTVPHDASLNIATGGFTLEAWVQLDDFAVGDTRRYYVAQKKDIGDKDGLASYSFIARMGNIADAADEQKLALELGDGVGPDGTIQRIVSDLLINDDQWHHVSVALHGTTGDVRFTLDDQVDLHAAAVNLANLHDNTDDLYIGAHPTPPNPKGTTVNHGFAGGIDELRISNTYLTESQLLAAVPEPSAVTLAAAGAALGCLLLTFHMRAGRRKR